MIDRIIHELARKRAETATDAMEAPGAGSLFAYGRSVGIYIGLSEAEEIIKKLLEEQDVKERRS